jgi:hypothetical protein
MTEALEWHDPRSWGLDEIPEYEKIYLGPYANFYAKVSKEDAPRLMKFLWHLAQESNPRCWYARRTDRRDGKDHTVYMHRDILERCQHRPSNRHVLGDHKSGDTLDNRRSNLRWSTPKENVTNRNGYPVWRLEWRPE